MPGDGAAGERIEAELGESVYAFRRRFDTETTIGILSRMQCVLSMRLHALIFAARVGVPHAGIVYDQKVKGFMRYMNAELYTDLEGVQAGTLYGFIDEMMRCDRAELSANARRLQQLEQKNVEEARRLMGETT